MTEPILGETGHWIFTFGFGHTHPVTGEPLANRYVRLPGDYEQARRAMIAHFGIQWAFQYPDSGAPRPGAELVIGDHWARPAGDDTQPAARADRARQRPSVCYVIGLLLPVVHGLSQARKALLAVAHSVDSEQRVFELGVRAGQLRAALLAVDDVAEFLHRWESHEDTAEGEEA